ncbi:hypothetical protein Hdeb2414_s0018g00516051 [Helianthus debilis subsp. tardiflorus]
MLSHSVVSKIATCPSESWSNLHDLAFVLVVVLVIAFIFGTFVSPKLPFNTFCVSVSFSILSVDRPKVKKVRKGFRRVRVEDP